MSRYVTCVNDPFNLKAEGAQVPDMYSFPTATSKCNVIYTFSVSSENAAAGGNVDFVVQPNIFSSLAVSCNWNTGTDVVVSGGAPWYEPDFANIPQTAYSGTRSFREFGVADAAQIAAQYDRYRVVSLS